MEKHDHYHGSLVAFEGPAEVVSTQLRLLPMSPQVLVLPSIQTYMKEGDDSRFSARALVRNAHRAAQERHSVAMSFLRGSSANNKRIVFLSGGTAGAVSQCISTISEHLAPGDFLTAESVFKNISQDGIKGLDQEEKYSDQRTLQFLSSEDDPEAQYWGTDEHEDPITKAMRAADALYKETESLQPVDCFTRQRPRSFSLPMYGYADGMGEPSPFFVFGSPPDEKAQSDSDHDTDGPTNCLRFMEEDYSHLNCIKSQQCNDRGPLVLNRPPSCVGEPHKPCTAETRSTMQLLSPTSDAFLSPPMTPDGVVYGEARLVQMRVSRTNKPPRKARSLDEPELHQTRGRQISYVGTAQLPKKMAPSDAPEAKSWHLSIVEDPYSSNNLLHLPQARFVKAHTTTIRRSTTFVKRLPNPVRESYVHHGTDAVSFDNEQRALDEPFQPVLPLTEDLVIYFTGEAPDRILDSVIQYFKSGPFPASPFQPASLHSGSTDSCPSMAQYLPSLEDQAGSAPVAERPHVEKLEEYDPFDAGGHDVRSYNWTLQTPSAPPSAVPVYSRQPPTPSQTPPPVMNTMDSRFYHFSTKGRRNAVVVQNALRSVLEAYFPPHQVGGYHQFGFPLLADMDNLWRPIFRENEAHGNNMSERNTDLILAIGCQRRVKRDFLPALMGQIEKLGAKSSGISRSGRLHIRYLIANAMQSFTAQPLAHQTHNNPFENPYLLACLIIPHLETYLAAHSSIRFLLLEYPAEHLATVLALQKLVGINIFKVAGIIDSEATSPTSDASSSSPTNKYSSGTVFNNTDTNSLDSISLVGSSSPDNKPTLAHRRKYSFSKANYLLTCSATESEIAVFISAIRKILIKVDPFYVSEYSPSSHGRPGTSRSIQGIITGGAVPLPNLAKGRNFEPAQLSPPMSPHLVNDGEEGMDSSSSTPRIASSAAALAHDFPFIPPPPRPPPPPRSTSPSPSTTGTRSSRERSIPGQRPRSRSTTGRRQLARAAAEGGGDDDGASGYAVSVVEEGEFYDDEERRLMPLFLRKRELGRGNSRKALKWLGLA